MNLDPKLTDDNFVINIKTHRDVVKLADKLPFHLYHETFQSVDKRGCAFILLQRKCEPFRLENGSVRVKKNCGWIGIANEEYRDEVTHLVGRHRVK